MDSKLKSIHRAIYLVLLIFLVALLMVGDQYFTMRENYRQLVKTMEERRALPAPGSESEYIEVDDDAVDLTTSGEYSGPFVGPPPAVGYADGAVEEAFTGFRMILDVTASRPLTATAIETIVDDLSAQAVSKGGVEDTRAALIAGIVIIDKRVRYRAIRVDYKKRAATDDEDAR